MVEGVLNWIMSSDLYNFMVSGLPLYFFSIFFFYVLNQSVFPLLVHWDAPSIYFFMRACPLQRTYCEDLLLYFCFLTRNTTCWIDKLTRVIISMWTRKWTWVPAQKCILFSLKKSILFACAFRSPPFCICLWWIGVFWSLFVAKFIIILLSPCTAGVSLVITLQVCCVSSVLP